MGLHVTIREAVREEGRTRVRFSSSIGEGWARWHSSYAPLPEIGKTYSAEPELIEPITSMKVIAPQADSITEHGMHIVLIGTIIQVDDDGVVVLSVGEGSMWLDGRDDFRENACVSITAKGLGLYDEGYEV